MTFKVLFFIDLSDEMMEAGLRLIVSRSVRSRPSAFQVATVSKPHSFISRISKMTDERTPKLSNSTLPVKPLYFVYGLGNYDVHH